MAINKCKSIADGQVTVEHHRVAFIPAITNTPSEQVIEVQCNEYQNKAAKVAGLVPLSSSTYKISISKSDFIGSQSDVLAAIYSKLMALDDFKDATME